QKACDCTWVRATLIGVTTLSVTNEDEMSGNQAMYKIEGKVRSSLTWYNIYRRLALGPFKFWLYIDREYTLDRAEQAIRRRVQGKFPVIKTHYYDPKGHRIDL